MTGEVRGADLPRRLAAEAIGTALLLAAVVGSGIMGERLAGGNVAIALLANAIATGAALVALITALAPISGAHFNPAVTLVEALAGRLPVRAAAIYSVVQIAAAVAGVMTAHAMFGEPLLQRSASIRSGWPQVWSEALATFGLLSVIAGAARQQPLTTAAVSVGAYITAAVWFTSSTSFANPAVTLARTLTDTFAGIRPVDAPAFIAGQLTGAVLAGATWRWLTMPRR